MKQNVQQFIKKYGLFEDDSVQQIQLSHRFSLVEAFQIKEGMRILEIGCGQGDTTMALADAVGKTGHVTAIDIANGNYGAPFTLAQMHEKIKQSNLGNQITFHLETNYETFPTAQYDAIILSHSSWYFQDINVLKQYIKKMSHETSTILFAEWDLDFTQIEQRNHFIAVTMIALYSTFVKNDGNIQHVIGASTLKQWVEEVGFKVDQTLSVDATYLQDGLWETYYAKEIAKSFETAPSTIQQYIANLLQSLNTEQNTKSLNSFVLICKK
jgi:cyclopropane fatty-acyl-phospholipid synthase-like methyltransferase